MKQGAAAETLEGAHLNTNERTGLWKEVYVQTQVWVKHYESLIIAINTILLGAAAAIAANFFQNRGSYSSDLFWLILCIALVGIVMTSYLSWQYKLALTRVVVYEKFFGLHNVCPGIDEFTAQHRIWGKLWERTFVPEYLNNPPRFGAASTHFFLAIHFAILVTSAVMLIRA